MRRLVVLLLLLLLPVLAATPFLTQLDALAQKGDIDGMARLIEGDPTTARESCPVLAGQLKDATPETKARVILCLRVIARTLQVRLNDPSMTYIVDKGFGPAPASMWQGTTLARVEPALKEESFLVLMRFGNFADALQLAPPGSRYAAACELGMGRPVEALEQAEKLLAGPLPAGEELPTRLLAMHACYQASLVARGREHLRKLEALPLPPGRYGEVAAFLRESYQLDLDLARNVDMPMSEVVQRHARAWAHLRTLGQATAVELAPFSSELFWIRDVAYLTWFTEVAALKGVADPSASAAQLKQVATMVVEDLTLVRAAGDRLIQVQHPELFYAGLDLLERYALLDMGPSPQQIAQSDETIEMLEGKIGPTYRRAKDEPPVPGLNFVRGALSNTVAGLFLVRAQNVVKSADGRPNAEQLTQFRNIVNLARPFLEEGGNVETWETLLLLDLDLQLSAQPPGWEEAATKALAEYRRVTGDLKKRAQQITYHHRLGELLLKQGRRAEGAAELQQAVDVLESALREFGGGPRLLQANRTLNRAIYETLARAQVQEGKNAEAFQTATRLQQLESSGTFTVNDLKDRVKPGDQGLVVRAEESQQRLQAAEQEAAALASAGAAPDRLAQANQVLAASRQAYFAVVTELEKKYPEFEKLDVKPINFAKLQRSIPQDTLVVLYFPTGEEVFLMEATSTNLTVRRVNQGRPQLNRMVGEWRKAVLSRQTPPTALYDALIAPLQADLKGKSTLAVIPYGSLMYVPFAALAPAGGKYLVQSKRVVTLCKATDLDQVFGPPAGRKGGLVAFGNPDGTLPAAGQEVKALGALFPGSKVYVEGQATSARLEGVHAPETAYLHLATHGVLDSRDPRGSYLKLAGGQKLTVPDITGARLDGPKGDLNLVTLSACQTALADRDPDGSDLRSLADAFSFAGCRSMVASLWSVNDDSTKVLMTNFYRGLKAGKGKAEALQAAQQAMLQGGSYQNPYYWAPFVLIGDWR